MIDMSDSWSVGELSTLAVKAARGVGLPWGLAEEAGWAVRWLAERGLPGIEALAGCLSDMSGQCALAAGTELADRNRIETRRLELISGPALLIPFLAHVAETNGAGLRAQIGDVIVDIHATGCRYDGTLPLLAAVDIAPAMIEMETQIPRRPCAPDPTALSCLERFAERTYAPSNPLSRLKGAGAGTKDND